MSDVHAQVIDLAKPSPQICATARRGAVLVNRPVSRAKLLQMLQLATSASSLGTGWTTLLRAHTWLGASCYSGLTSSSSLPKFPPE